MKVVNISIVGAAILVNAAFLVWHYDLFAAWEAGPDRAELHALITDGKAEEARALAVTHFEAMLATHGSSDLRSLEAGKLLAMVLRRSERHTEALALYEQLYAAQTRAESANLEQQIKLLSEMIGMYLQADQLDPAIGSAREKLALREAALGPGSTVLLGDLLTLADLYRQRGDYAAARAELERGMHIIDGDHHRHIRMRNHLYFTLLHIEQEEAAAIEAEKRGEEAPTPNRQIPIVPGPLMIGSI